MVSTKQRELQVSNPEKIKESVLEELRCNRLQLPTLPEVALHIRDALQDEEVSQATIAKIVTKDPAICTKLLQVVNSPLYRSNTPIDNIKLAISRLGYAQIKNLVCSLAMKQMYQSTSKIVNTMLHDCWNHSARVAAIASVLANDIPGINKDQAILAGLVHDIGKLPLILHAEKIQTLINDPGAMRTLFMSLHTDVGSHVLTNWNFPEELISVARDHEDLSYQSSDKANYTDIIIVANLYSYHNKQHTVNEEDWGHSPSFKQLGVTADSEFMSAENNIMAIADVEQILKS